MGIKFMSGDSHISSLKPERPWLHTFLCLIAAFLISSLSLLLGYVLKNLNPAEYGLIQGGKQDLELTYKEILFFTSLVLAFFVLSAAFRYLKGKWKIVLVGLALVYLFAACFMVLADVIYYLIFAYRITFSSVQTVLNTNPDEVKGFIKLYHSTGSILALLIFITVCLLAFFRRAYIVSVFSTGSFFMASGLISVFGVVDFIQVAHSKGNGTHNVRYWDIIIGEYNEYRAFNRKLEAEKNTHNFSKEYDGFYKQDTLAKTLVFVVSESLSKQHMSLYGYPRHTTPHLDTNKSLFKFNDCVSQAALTIEAVPGLFFNGYLEKRINLITLLNRLGYETTWISNQSGWGKTDGTIVLLSQLCKTTTFLDALADNDKANSSQHYDEDVLLQLDKALSEPSQASKFIVLHLMGCHFDYEKRYPAEKAFFTSRPPAKVALSQERVHTIVNSYDNAMLYHDSVVNQILTRFEAHSRGKNAALVFLSDHGEELYENRDYAGHGYPPTKVTSEIPYFAVLSPGFKKNYPAMEAMMKRRINTPYSAANNFYTLLHLLNINSKNYQGKIRKYSFFSPAYDSTGTRLVMGNDYSKMTM